MFAILASILFGLGAAALAAITVYIVKLTIQALFSKIKNRIVQKQNRTVVAADVRQLLGNVIEEATKKRQKISLTELEEKFGTQGVVLCDLNENGEVDVDSIEIEKTNSRDKQIDSLLKENDGCLLVSA